MFYFAKPEGGLYFGKRLLNPPAVREMISDAPVRIVFLSDLHLRRGQDALIENTARLVETLRPELLLIGGDIAEYRDGARAFADRFSAISPEYGSFAVCGNNDDQRFQKDPEEFVRIMQSGGIRVLLNECARIPLGKGHIELAGVKDSFLNTPCAKGLFSKEEGAYRILLSHMPLASTLSECDPAPDLMLSGHTHGGQINVLRLTCYELLGYEHRYRYTHISGEKRIGKTLCLVSNGIGTSKYPVRFGAEPQIHLITQAGKQT